MLEQARLGITTYVRQACYQLAMTSNGPALGIVKDVERNNGFEVWRLFFTMRTWRWPTFATHDDANLDGRTLQNGCTHVKGAGCNQICSSSCRASRPVHVCVKC